MIVYDTLPEKYPADTAAVALGMFDGLHRGHLAVLNALCKETTAVPHCVFTFSTADGKPDSKTGLRLLSRRMRDSLLEDIGIDYVFQPEFSTFKDMSPQEFAHNFLGAYLNAKFVYCGEDFRFGKNASAGAADLAAMLPKGSVVRIVPEVSALGGVISTTRIRGMVEAGDMRGAAQLLGRPFTIDFSVEHGRKLGRTLNWPTINQPFPDDFTIPKFGVYASVTTVGGVRRASVTNVGIKPTVGSEHLLAETYIQDFSGDLYGESIPVELIEFIRGEQKFTSVDELKGQIKRDAELALKKSGG